MTRSNKKVGMMKSNFWFPLTAEEPSLDESTLASLDVIADRVEVLRLQDMTVFGERARHI